MLNQAVDKKREMLDMEEEQDMFDPEFYLSQYQVKNVMDLSMKTLCGMYRDVVSWGGSMGSGPVQEDRGGVGWMGKMGKRK